jgi:hypothetical protein
MATFPMLRDRVDRFKLRSYMLLDLVEAQVTSETLLGRVTEIRRQIATIMDLPSGFCLDERRDLDDERVSRQPDQGSQCRG